MLPFSEQTGLILALAVAMGVAAIFFATVRTRRIGVQGLLGLALLFGLAPFALTQPSDAYVLRLSLIMSVWTLGLLAVAAAWGLLSAWIGRRTGRLAPTGRRRLVASLTALALTLGPATTAAAFIVERQWVPDAACAERAVFQVGDRAFAVPREVGAFFTVADQPGWRGWYSDYVKKKPDVAEVCARTDNGARPLRVETLRFAFSAMKGLLPADCIDAPVPSAACEVTHRKDASSLRFLPGTDRVPEEWARHFRAARTDSDMASGGDLRAGHVCGTMGHRIRRCAVWQPVDGGLLAVARIGHGEAIPDARYLALARAGMALALDMAEPEEEHPDD